jgi:hypothetical protein
LLVPKLRQILLRRQSCAGRLRRFIGWRKNLAPQHHGGPSFAVASATSRYSLLASAPRATFFSAVQPPRNSG